ncbi:Hypothetical protein R9X50_00579400 [Acrodontium crateriforme]|uniref:C2H2-type domain-containing protein n=1 Tax=Acrodontium crateriforme TaxID=150365 RepID=A0AAQ3R9E2_9PEZI|nr:Hypothetical protein R9X50_00579400 [Acrodontium crateriforme]
MAPRGHTLPQAATESAREARKSFFCDLCQKGYSRMPDFEAHQNSYDHQHKKRYQDMKQMSKDPNAAAKARAAEQRANEEAGLKAINLASAKSSMPSSSGKKKPVFKSTLQPHNAAAITPSSNGSPSGGVGSDDQDLSNAKANGWWEARYRPEVITACEEFCGEHCVDCGGKDIILGT